MNEHLLAVTVCRSVVESRDLLLVFGLGCVVSHSSHQLKRGRQENTTWSHECCSLSNIHFNGIDSVFFFFPHKLHFSTESSSRVLEMVLF